MRVKIFSWIAWAFISLSIFLCGCSRDEEVRTPADILGVWKLSDTQYYDFMDDYTVRNLFIEDRYGENLGILQNEVYFYEPGYNILIYLSAENRRAEVYEITELTSSKLTWCWVRRIDASDVNNADGLGHLVGMVIKEAQEGYTLLPENYQSLTKVSEDSFLKIIEGLTLNTPW